MSHLIQYPIGAKITLADLEGDIYPLLHRLRVQEPVSWVPVLKSWLVTNRDLAIKVMRDAQMAVKTMIAALGLEASLVTAVLAWYDTIVDAVTEVTTGEPVSPEGRAAFAVLRETLLPNAIQRLFRILIILTRCEQTCAPMLHLRKDHMFAWGYIGPSGSPACIGTDNRASASASVRKNKESSIGSSTTRACISQTRGIACRLVLYANGATLNLKAQFVKRPFPFPLSCSPCASFGQS